MNNFSIKTLNAISSKSKQAAYLLQFDVTASLDLNSATLVPCFRAVVAGTFFLPESCSRDTEQATIKAGINFLKQIQSIESAMEAK